MALMLPPLRMTGADILRDGELQRRSIAIAEGRITRGPLPEVDLSGYLILPGIIDLHSTGVERHLAAGLREALSAADREAAAQGVTTAFLAQGWSWEGGCRGPDQAEALLAALDNYRPRALTDLRVQIRAETHLVGEGARLLAAVRRHRVGYVVFTDQLETGFQTQRGSGAKFALWARDLGVTPDALLARMQAARAQARAVPRHLCTLAEGFDALGVCYGSHDDPDGETRELYSMIGARIAEFPSCRQAAAAAHAMMNPVVIGAPNVLREAGQAGAVAARDLIAAGLCDALASDDRVAALPLAVWALVDLGILTLPRAWALVSANPAEILRMPDRGRLDPGKRADLVVVNAQTRAIEATISGGRLSFLTGGVARRFKAQPQAMQVAAE